MQNTNATSFRKNLFNILEQTIKFNEPINISTKDGNAIVLSEEDYNDMVETLRVNADPKYKAILIENKNTPFEDCIAEAEVEW